MKKSVLLFTLFALFAPVVRGLDGTECLSGNSGDPAGQGVVICGITWATQNGRDGCLFTDRVNGNKIFFAVPGYRHFSNGSLYGSGVYGYSVRCVSR